MLQIPDTSENTDYFGFSSNQIPTKTALASVSILYDVLNDMIVDETISTYPANERKLAKSHIESFQKLGVTHTTIFTLDRGYPSYDMFEWFHHKKLSFVIRLSSSFRSFDSLKTDSIINYSIKEDTKKIRLLKVVLPLTNIYEETITSEMFKKLYFLRWGVESKYKELKSSMEIEEFSGTKPVAIKQDFYVSIYLSKKGRKNTAESSPV